MENQYWTLYSQCYLFLLNNFWNLRLGSLVSNSLHFCSVCLQIAYYVKGCLLISCFSISILQLLLHFSFQAFHTAYWDNFYSETRQCWTYACNICTIMFQFWSGLSWYSLFTKFEIAQTELILGEIKIEYLFQERM